VGKGKGFRLFKRHYVTSIWALIDRLLRRSVYRSVILCIFPIFNVRLALIRGWSFLFKGPATTTKPKLIYMKFKIRHIHVIVAGLICILVIGFIIKKQNDILIHPIKQNGYTAYNKAATQSEAADLIAVWEKNPSYSKAVKKIVYLDYLWMVFFGGTILYALAIGCYYNAVSWKYLFIAAMALLVLAVSIDIIQDNNIYQHLTQNQFCDFRYLTKLKFTFLIIAIVIGLFAIIKHWRIVLRGAFWKQAAD